MIKIKNQKGITLVELLATVVILFIISLFIFNIVYSSTNQNESQRKESSQINDAAYLLKQITKDIRKTNNLDSHDLTTNTYIFKGDSLVIKYKYNAVNKKLYRYVVDDPENGVIVNEDDLKKGVIVNNVDAFSIPNPTSNQLEIKFTINGKNYDTKIALRKGNN